MYSGSRFLVCSLLLLMTLPALLVAQVTGTITGTVLDSSGAAVPEAKVTATSIGTNLSRTTVTDPSGQYVLPMLAVGTYEIRVEKEGFTPFLQKGALVQANSQVAADATLQVKSGTEQVTVSSTANLLQTNSSSMVQVVDQQRVADLPLNGRNVLSLISLDAGVLTRNVPSSVTQSYVLGKGLYYTPMAMAGARGGAGNFLLDNADNNDAQTAMPRPFPNVDAVEEFSVQTNTFDAQYGRSVGGVVNVVTKSGTNALHGTAFEFLRNFDMNAANLFSGRDRLKRNQFGGGLGGPIRKDRTFVFGSFQGTRISNSTPAATVTAPSAAMVGGDFSAWLASGGVGAIHDPLAGNGYFPNNVIPQNRFDPVSVKLLQMIPTASSSAAYQLRFGTPAQYTSDNQGVLRVDHSLTDRQHLSFRYFVFHYELPANIMPNNVLYGWQGQLGYSQSLAVNHTYTISSRWLNTLTAAYAFSQPTTVNAQTPDLSLKDLGANVLTVPGTNIVNIGITGWSGISYNGGAATYTRSMHIADSVGYATGRHNLRFGGETRRYKTGATGYYRSGGDVSFTGQLLSDGSKQNAGNAYAEFLLGDATTFQQAGATCPTQPCPTEHRYYSVFVQDDIRVTNKLTINAGLRWEPRAGLSNRDDETYLPGQQSTLYPNAPAGLIFKGDPGLPNGTIPNSYKNFAPRIGLAYEVAPKTVIRAAYGIFYDDFPSNVMNTVIQGLPWTPQATLQGPLQLSNPYAGGAVLNPVGFTPSSGLVFPNYLAYQVPGRNMRPGYVQSWNAVIERQLRSDLLVRASYVASKGTDLINELQENPGIYAPGATAGNINSRRPIPRIGSLYVFGSMSNSSYQSGQFTVQKRYGRGFSLLANYTWSKSIDDSSDPTGFTPGPDPWNHGSNRGPADFDITQRLVVSGVWQLPSLTSSPAAIRWTLGGWQANGIFTAETGLPLTIASGVNNALDGESGDFGAYSGGAWQLPGGRARKDQIAQWFNTSAFAVNAIGSIGTARRGQLRAPGDSNLDFSLFKTFPVREKTALQFRSEFFNVANHPNLGPPNTTVTSPSFGRITTALDPRIVQLALKLIF